MTDVRIRWRVAATVGVLVLGASACGGGGSSAAAGPASTTAPVGTEPVQTTTTLRSDAYVPPVNALCVTLFNGSREISQTVISAMSDTDYADQAAVDAASARMAHGADHLNALVDDFVAGTDALDLPADVQAPVDATVDLMRDVADTHEMAAQALSLLDTVRLQKAADLYSGKLADRADALANTFQGLRLQGCSGS